MALSVRFTFDPSGTPTNRDYHADRVRVEWEIDGDEYRLLNDTAEVDVRKIWLLFTVSGVFESSNAATYTAADIWLEALKGTTAMRIYPDSTNANAYANIVPDLSHRPTIMATRFGSIQKGQELRFISATGYDPTDAVLPYFADFIDL